MLQRIQLCLSSLQKKCTTDIELANEINFIFQTYNRYKMMYLNQFCDVYFK